jgi:uncharacterized ferritin-like protein (DUF455 family)
MDCDRNRGLLSLSGMDDLGMSDVSQRIRAVLLTADPRAKVMATRALARDWRLGRINPAVSVRMPDRPAWPDAPVLLPPNKMPNRRRAGSVQARVAILHAFAHIEFSAIDLALDAAGRFGDAMPRDFTSDWLSVAADEALHFALLDRRLRQLGSHYGALPAHAGLWEAAESTAHDLGARLAVVPMVLEARGLDVSPATISRLTAAGDLTSARILQRIYTDEIRHVGIGSKWFHQHCNSNGCDAESEWQRLVSLHFRGSLKPPFNDSARLTAGLPRHYYETLVSLTALPQ